MNARAIVGLIAGLGVALASSGCISWTFGDDLPYLDLKQA